MSTIAFDNIGTQPLEVGRARIEYPFKANGDLVTKTITRSYKQAPGYFTPTPLGSADLQFPDCYLVSESDPVATQTNLDSFTRTYANVPAPVVVYSSQAITKPNPSTLGTSKGTLTDYTTLFSGSSLGTAYAYGSSLFANNLVFSRIVVSGTRTVATGGTFTLTYKANTTAALAYNASFATIDAALNGLASVVSDGLTSATSNGGFSVTGQFQINWTAGSTTTAVTCNAASLTPSACTIAFGSVQSSTVQLVGIATRAIATAHGLASSGNLICSTSSSDTGQALLPYGTQWSVVDANTLAVASSYVQTNPAYVGQQTRAYTPGTDRVGIKKTKTFYLPGITSGISTPADIAIPSPLLNDAEFFAAAVATTSGYLTYDSSALEIWMGQIYAQEATAINMADI